MQLVISGKNIELTDALRSYVEEKIGKVKKYFESIIEVDVTLGLEKGATPEESKFIEVILFSSGVTIHAREEHSDMYAAIDLVADKLERQVKKHKEKIKSKHRKQKEQVKYEAMHSLLKVEDDHPKIIRTSKFAIKPMYVEEAAAQLDLLQQDFFVFTNAETDEVNVIYKRKDGNFGLIAPEA